MKSLSKYIFEKLIIRKDMANNYDHIKKCLFLGITYGSKNTAMSDHIYNHIDLFVKTVKSMSDSKMTITLPGEGSYNSDYVSLFGSKTAELTPNKDGFYVSKPVKLYHGGEVMIVALTEEAAKWFLEDLMNDPKQNIEITDYICCNHPDVHCMYYDRKAGYHREYSKAQIKNLINKL